MRIASHNVPDITRKDCPDVTVFCAVWHKQANKESLLRSHWDNLQRQSIPVEACYIFDNGDAAPEWLDAPWHSFSEPLTIYEAWAAGAALCRTRYVMNLNMDDRLADGAVSALLGLAKATGAALVGGEWSIRFDRDHLDEAFELTDLLDTRFAPAWPPQPAEGLRLGSSTVERGTYGPATMWDLAQTGKPYPTYFGNGAPILSMGDAIFWELVKASGLKMHRLPMVIGRYLSDPTAQAEFRANDDQALLSAHGLSAVSFGTQVMERAEEIRREREAGQAGASETSDPRGVEAVATQGVKGGDAPIAPSAASKSDENGNHRTGPVYGSAPAPAIGTAARYDKAVESDLFTLLGDNDLRRQSRSQLGQDIFAAAVAGQKRNGFFVEFGATDGVSLSNSWMLETHFGWSGILAEPARCWHSALAKRSAVIDHRCVWSRSGETMQFMEAHDGAFSSLKDYVNSDHHAGMRQNGRSYEVETVSLNDLLAGHDAPGVIDYLSIDTEGSELDILQAFDFDAFDVRSISCEHNHTNNRDHIHDLLKSKGFSRIALTVSKWDDWYVKEPSH